MWECPTRALGWRQAMFVHCSSLLTLWMSVISDYWDISHVCSLLFLVNSVDVCDI